MKLFAPSLKKFNLYLIFGLAILLLFVNSCRKDHGPSDQVADNPSIQKISSWYKSSLKLSDENPFSKLRPQWKDVHVAQQDYLKVYEISLSNPERLFVASGHIDRSALDSEEEKHEIRLLIFENTLTGKIRYGCYMSVEAVDGNIPEKLHYKNVGELNGTVLFYNFNGTLANGWTYAKGKLANQLTAISKAAYEAQKQGQAMGPRGKVMSGYQCVSGWADKYKWGCVTVGNGSPSCGWINVGQEYVTNCNEEPIDHREGPDEEGAGSGGYIPPVFYDCNDVRDGTASDQNSCNICMGGNTGIEACPLELKTDSLKAKFPCADKLIAQPILTSAIMSKFVEPFLTPQRPTVTYLTDNTLPWGNATTGGTFELGNNTPVNSGAGLSSTVRFNEKMLQNSSQLLIAATVVHETLHAYINYKIAIANSNYTNYNNSNWMVGLDNFYLMGNLPANYSNHTMMLEDYFDKSMAVLQAWNAKQGFIYSMKDMASAMLYGLDTYDTGVSQTQISNITSVFDNVKTKYGVTTLKLDSFNRANLIATTNKLPTTGCN